jgi:hypothetical protein
VAVLVGVCVAVLVGVCVAVGVDVAVVVLVGVSVAVAVLVGVRVALAVGVAVLVGVVVLVGLGVAVGVAATPVPMPRIARSANELTVAMSAPTSSPSPAQEPSAIPRFAYGEPPARLPSASKPTLAGNPSIEHNCSLV